MTGVIWDMGANLENKDPVERGEDAAELVLDDAKLVSAFVLLDKVVQKKQIGVDELKNEVLDDIGILVGSLVPGSQKSALTCGFPS